MRENNIYTKGYRKEARAPIPGADLLHVQRASRVYEPSS